MLSAKNNISIVRIIPDLDVRIVIPCAVGQIAILEDSEGGCLAAYQRIIATGIAPAGRVEAPDGSPLPVSNRVLVGFSPASEPPPADEPDSIGGVLLEAGFHEDECEELIQSYDLADKTYLPFKLLSPTVQRQLELLVLIRKADTSKSTKLLVLNDPFLPFNGRWREAFAEKLLAFVQKAPVAVVVMNLSFRPKAWAHSSHVREIDLVGIEQRAIQRQYSMKVEEEKQIVPERPKSVPSKALQTDPIVGGHADLNKRSRSPLFGGWGDVIIPHLARFSSTVRSLHGLLAFTFLTVLAGSIGLLSYPQAKEGWAKMKLLSERPLVEPVEESEATLPDIFEGAAEDSEAAVVRVQPEEPLEQHPDLVAVKPTEIDSPVVAKATESKRSSGSAAESFHTPLNYTDSLQDQYDPLLKLFEVTFDKYQARNAGESDFSCLIDE